MTLEARVMPFWPALKIDAKMAVPKQLSDPKPFH
jgi:hypothetical protein